MFQPAIILGDTQSSIILHTRLGNPIENSIEPDPGEPGRQKFERLTRRFGSQWEVRRPAVGRYNCAGLVFANRRTSIFAPDLYLQIFSEDGYTKFNDVSSTRCGDVVAYAEQDGGEIVHLALIMSFRPGISDLSPLVPMALSKWDSAMGEVVHNIYTVPYDLTSDYRIEFWTDRPL
jgi:hypothetical protein